MTNSNSFECLIDSKSIFGEYAKQEDRVTAALLQILNIGGHPLVEDLFSDCDIPSNEIFVESQYVANKSRPDGRISCECKYDIFIESKIVVNSINITQLNNHQKLLNDASQWLVYITPDTSKPKELIGLRNVLWYNWREIVDSLKSFDNKDSLLSFLINQFEILVEHIVYKVYKRVNNRDVNDQEKETQSVIDDFELNENNERVIIVGGSWGESVALDYNVYLGQEGRFFHPSSYITFAYNNRIKKVFKIIGEFIPSIDISTIPELKNSDYFIKKEPGYSHDKRCYFKLEFFRDVNIQNDYTDKNGRRCAFTRRQRYTTIDKLLHASKTSELV